MSAVILAVFNDYEAAERVRVMLVRDGFPTDRVELTASCELGRAGCEPADSLHGKCVQYFRTLLKGEDERSTPKFSPNGRERSSDYYRASAWCDRDRTCDRDSSASSSADVVGHDLANHGWEHAAAKHEGYWVQHVWLESSPETDCIYCRLFPGSSH